MQGMPGELRGHLVPVRKGRPCSRADLGRPSANRHSNTHKSVFLYKRVF